LAIPASSAFNLSPKRARTASRNRKRLARKARVAPIDEANETTRVPTTTPKSAPPASVMTSAPGNDRPVTATYTMKNAAMVSNGRAA